MRNSIVHIVHLKHGLIVLMMQCAFLCAAHAQVTVFTYRQAESKLDQRYVYDHAVLQLALEKTRAKYGAFSLVPSPPMNFLRAMHSLTANAYPNFFVKQSYEEQYVSSMKLTFVRFPVDLGIVGYRICFTNDETKQRLQSVNSLPDLQAFSMGQGYGWADVEILRSNGFNVTQAPYESLFQMVAIGRFNLFCRGVNEFLEEWNRHKDIKGLTYDESIAIAYPLPRFFFTHPSNSKAAERIEEGILMAYKDGSLYELWHANYKESIDFAQLKKRKIFWLENPNLAQIDFNYRQYFCDPFDLKNSCKGK